VVESTLSPLAGWDSFYVIIGSSAAALTGLQFVVIALSSERGAASVASVRAFGTPTIVHFGAVLLLAAILTTPGHTVATLSFCLGVCGAVGVGFTRWVVIQTRRQKEYTPLPEDWQWHVIWPAVAYGGIAAGAAALWWRPATALVVVGAGAVFLLYIGIHNAWDAAIWISVRRGAQTDSSGGRTEAKPR
jgi:hypothetical protein